MALLCRLEPNATADSSTGIGCSVFSSHRMRRENSDLDQMMCGNAGVYANQTQSLAYVSPFPLSRLLVRSQRTVSIAEGPQELQEAPVRVPTHYVSTSEIA